MSTKEQNKNEDDTNLFVSIIFDDFQTCIEKSMTNACKIKKREKGVLL